MMFERLITRAKRLGEAAVLMAIARLADKVELPADVTLEIGKDGVKLSARKLRRRMIDDPRLRRIGR